MLLLLNYCNYFFFRQLPTTSLSKLTCQTVFFHFTSLHFTNCPFVTLLFTFIYYCSLVNMMIAMIMIMIIIFAHTVSNTALNSGNIYVELKHLCNTLTTLQQTDASKFTISAFPSTDFEEKFSKNLCFTNNKPQPNA